jgi:hypothetical protein
MVGILPEDVRQRTTHGVLDEVIDHSFRCEGKGKVELFLEGARTSQRQFLDRVELELAWQEYYNRRQRLSKQLVTPLLLQAWLQCHQEFN